MFKYFCFFIPARFILSLYPFFNMADTYQSFVNKINNSDKNIFGLKRTPKDTIAVLKILKNELMVKMILIKFKGQNYLE